MSYYWAQEMGTQDQWQREFEIGSSATVVDWRNYMRDICAEWLIRNPTRIGGQGIVCEIDETMAVRRKYERGRLVVNDVWLFGGTERGHPERCFIVPVARRDAATLLPLIVQHIEPGSIIHSDCWRAYGGIPQLPNGYQHLTVNHTQNFVDPITGAHTQSIESLWQKMKLKAKKRFGDSRSLYDTYMSEFLWRKQFGDHNDVFFNFWSQVLCIHVKDFHKCAVVYLFMLISCV